MKKSVSTIEKPKAKDMSICQNCRKTFETIDLDEITHGFWERVSPSEIMPAGECPECGALCHPLETAVTPYENVIKKLLDTVRSTGGLVMYPDGTLAPVADEDWIDLGDVVQAARGVMGSAYNNAKGMKMRIKKVKQG
jgi:hypothetical protein